jgi:hypothetical protein
MIAGRSAKEKSLKKETLTVPTHCNTVELTLLTVACCQIEDDMRSGWRRK